jgi:NADH-quinone oxidoreductase subunit E
MSEVDLAAEWDRLQAEYGYLPERLLRDRCQALGVSLGSGLSVVLRSPGRWRLEPPGRHCVSVCVGPSCGPRGGPEIRSALENAIPMAAEQTLPDGSLSLTTVFCCGACGHAPNIVIDKTIHSHMTPESAVELARGLFGESTPKRLSGGEHGEGT